jgi:hypothetical protein
MASRKKTSKGKTRDELAAQADPAAPPRGVVPGLRPAARWCPRARLRTRGATLLCGRSCNGRPRRQWRYSPRPAANGGGPRLVRAIRVATSGVKAMRAGASTTRSRSTAPRSFSNAGVGTTTPGAPPGEGEIGAGAGFARTVLEGWACGDATSGTEQEREVDKELCAAVRHSRHQTRSSKRSSS